jgi:RNA polymerase sigma-32 factor
MARLLSSEEGGFSRYVREIQRFPRLEREEELALAVRWHQSKDRIAADSLVQSHLRDVVAIASHYRGYGFRLADLVEEGNIGLCEAVHRFDPSRNLRFMTYAAYWVRAYILAHVLKQFSMVGVGTGPMQSKLFFRLARERARLSSRLGEGDTTITSALAAHFETSEQRVTEMVQRLERRDASLDAQVFDDGESTLLDTLRADGLDQESEAVESQRNRQIRALLDHAWGHLDERERMIVTERLLADGEGATLADLGKRLKLSRERVRQLESRVKNKLRVLLKPIAAAA